MLRRRHQEGSRSFSQRPGLLWPAWRGNPQRAYALATPDGEGGGRWGKVKGAKNTCRRPVASRACKRQRRRRVFKTSSPCIPFATPCTTSDFIPTATATDFALTGPIRHGCLERARHKRQHEQGQFAKGGVRPLPRPEAPMHLGSQRAPVPAVCPGKRCVHRPSAAPDGPTPPAVSQCQQQQQQPHPWSEPRSI